MIPPPPTSTLFPYTTLFRSDFIRVGTIQIPVHLSFIFPRPAAQQSTSGDGRRVHGRSDRKSTRLNSSHVAISYAVFCLKKKKKITTQDSYIHLHTYTTARHS